MLASKIIYTVGIPDYWETLTPPLQHSLVGDAVIEYQVEPLIRMGEQGIMEPVSAKSWELSADHRKLIFKIDTARRFSDGSFLCAKDFKRSWEDGLRMTPKSSNSSLADGLGNIKGYSSFKKKGEIEGVQVIGNDTLMLEFDKPVRLALKYLSGGRVSAYKMVGENIIGTGPYVVTEKNKELKLTPNPYYIGKKPALKNVKIVVVPPEAILKKMESGEVDAYLFAETASLPGCDSGTMGTIRCARGQEASHSIIQLNGLKGRFFADAKHRLAFQALMAKHREVVEKRHSPRGFMSDSQSFLKFQAGRVSDVEAQAIIRSGEQYIPRLIKATERQPLFLASTASGGGWLMDLLRKDGIRFTKSSETDFEFKKLLEMCYKTWAPDLLPLTSSVSDGDPDGLYHLLGRHGAIFSPMTERKNVCDGMESGRQLLDLSKLATHYQKVSRAILEEVPYVHQGYFYRRMAYNAKRLKVNDKLLGRNNPNIMLLNPR